jgi:dienelactone hydrolase
MALLAAPAPPSTGATTTGPPYRVGIRAIKIVEHRTMRLPGGRLVPRTLETYVRYPRNGPGHYPLVVFAHGFNVTPHPYAAMLAAIARAGFVVAAPVFPLTGAHAPGGANENDLLNQPGDMSAVITRMILDTRRAGSPFHGLVNGQEVAVAGQSDGGITALLAAYNRRYRDRRVKAAIIMSGAEVSAGSYDFAPGSPPLLAMQGTADTTNLPKNTYRLFDQAARPKFLLKLLGAQHLPPYTTEQPQLGIVERTSAAFLNLYLNHRRDELRRLKRAGNVRGVTALRSEG